MEARLLVPDFPSKMKSIRNAPMRENPKSQTLKKTHLSRFCHKKEIKPQPISLKRFSDGRSDSPRNEHKITFYVLGWFFAILLR